MYLQFKSKIKSIFKGNGFQKVSIGTLLGNNPSDSSKMNSSSEVFLLNSKLEKL